MLRRTKRALAETGLKVHDIEVVRIHDDADLKAYLPGLRAGAELGARQVIATANCRGPKPHRRIAGRTLRSRQAIRLDDQPGVPHLEPHRDAAGCGGNLSRGQPRHCGLLIDTLHFNRSRVRPEELDDVPRQWFHFAHVCDAPKRIAATREDRIHTGRAERPYPGEGGIDLAAILRHLPEIPYSLEIPHHQRVREFGYAGHARRCLEAARRYFGAERAAAATSPA